MNTSKHQRHRFGRPLLGDEPLNERVAVPISASMKAKLEVKAAGGSVADVIRKILEKHLSRKAKPSRLGGASIRGRGRGKKVKRGRGVRRFRRSGV